MHNYSKLISYSVSFTLTALNEAHDKILKSLQKNARTIDIVSIQMLQLQKSIHAIGMFSMFESILQEKLSCRDGFKEAKKQLKERGKNELYQKFETYILAINVLKHGKGNSYNALVKKSKNIPFKIKLPGEFFFNEGDVAEVSTLIEVDDIFVYECANLIELISNELLD